MLFYCFVIFSITNFVRASELSFTQIEGVFPHGNSSHNGSIVGFADINGDNFTDVLYVNTRGKELRVMLMAHGQVHFDYALLYLSEFLPNFGPIRSVILSDFSGPPHLDVIILVGPLYGPYFMFSYSNIGNISLNSKPISLDNDYLIAHFEKEPLLFHYDNDNIPDLLAIDANLHLWTVWQYRRNKWIPSVNILDFEISKDVGEPIYSLFLDIDSDYSAEVMLTDYVEEKFYFYGRSSSFGSIDFSKAKKEIRFPPTAKQIASPIVADWCLNGTVGLLLAYCDHVHCHGNISKLAVFNLKNGDNWIEYEIPNLHWVASYDIHLKLITPPRITPLRIVDVNMDAYPDVIVTIQNRSSNKNVLGALINKCNRGMLNFSLAKIDTNITSAIPFDFMEDGKLDIFSNDMRTMKLHRINFGQNNIENVNFLKVSVLPGYCSSAICPVSVISRNRNYSYSLLRKIPSIGVSLSLEVKNENGKMIFVRGYLGSDASYLALQLPYYLFSLSENMKVSSLTIGLFRGHSSLRSFDTINSKDYAVINPFDINNPDTWSIELISKGFNGKNNFIGILCVFIVIGFALLLVILLFRCGKQCQKIPEVQMDELMSSME